MSQNTPSPEKPPWMAAFNSKVLTIVIASVFGGIWLDRVLGTRPLFTVGLVVLSAPLSLALTFWIARRATQDLQPPPASKQDDLNKEENSSE
jgi:F0F1-type ATP synthase assembly protein I